MTDDPVGSEVVRGDLRDPFAMPKGVLGAIAGRLMAGGNRRQQVELIEALGPGPGPRVLEVGFGPGVLAAELLARNATVVYTGVDPSAVMLAQARKRNASSAAEGRATFGLGAAGRLPFDDGAFDVVVAVNNVRLWPDVAAAAAEIGRVLATGGAAWITWHGRTSPSALQRRLAMDDGALATVEQGLTAGGSGRVERRSLPSSEAFVLHRT